MVTNIERFNLLLGRHLKYLISFFVMVVAVILADYFVEILTLKIADIVDFILNTLIIIGIIVVLSIVSSFVLEKVRISQQIQLGDFLKKHLFWILLLIFILIGIILNVKYAKFTPETEAILRKYSIIDTILNFFGL